MERTSATHTSDHPILCFGEALWDSLPEGMTPGGAPMNVAYHLHRLGCRALPVTAVGDDRLGHALREQLQRWEIDTGFVAMLPASPTGRVEVTLDARGTPRYTILQDVAWDHIPLSGELLDAAERSAAIVFGTLAQRSAWNRRSLLQLLDHATGSMKVLDVNLRPPFDDHALVWELARRATLIKLNDEELAQLLGEERGDDPERGARSFAGRIGGPNAGEPNVCITAGADGAGLLLEGTWHWSEARRVEVRDTIGAGDAFLAALVAGLLGNTAQPERILAGACRLGEFVAASEGATPRYEIDSLGAVTVPPQSSPDLSIRQPRN